MKPKEKCQNLKAKNKDSYKPRASKAISAK